MKKKNAKKIMFLGSLTLIFLSSTYYILHRNEGEKASLSTAEQVSNSSSKEKKKSCLMFL